MELDRGMCISHLVGTLYLEEHMALRTFRVHHLHYVHCDILRWKSAIYTVSFQVQHFYFLRETLLCSYLQYLCSWVIHPSHSMVILLPHTLYDAEYVVVDCVEVVASVCKVAHQTIVCHYILT